MRDKSRSNRAKGVVVALGCALAACGNIDGGAVELSWKLRPASSALEDKFVNCDSQLEGTGPVTEIRLSWTVETTVNGVPEQQTASEQWPCNDSHGVTGFVLPEGSALFSITPLCTAGDALPSSFIAPAVEQRRVIVGDTVNLGAIELVVQVSDCTVQPCICQ